MPPTKKGISSSSSSSSFFFRRRRIETLSRSSGGGSGTSSSTGSIRRLKWTIWTLMGGMGLALYMLRPEVESTSSASVSLPLPVHVMASSSVSSIKDRDDSIMSSPLLRHESIPKKNDHHRPSLSATSDDKAKAKPFSKTTRRVSVIHHETKETHSPIRSSNSDGIAGTTFLQQQKATKQDMTSHHDHGAKKQQQQQQEQQKNSQNNSLVVSQQTLKTSATNMTTTTTTTTTAAKWGIIHLGKCGGVSLEKTLKGYHGYNTTLGHIVNEATSSLSKPTWYHLSKPNVSLANHWLVLVRDPIARIQSWWMYDHMDNFYYREDYLYHIPYQSYLWPKLFQCYPTLDEFCTHGLIPIPTTTSDAPNNNTTQHLTECQMLAHMAIPSRNASYLSGIQHLRFNFFQYFAPLLQQLQQEEEEEEEEEQAYHKNDNHYNTTTTTKTSMYVVRSEHMLNDLNTINVMLSDDDDDRKNPINNINKPTANPILPGVEHISHWRSEEYPMKDRAISPKGMTHLCRQLCHEIQLYKQILYYSRNMDDDSRAQSMKKLSKSCPIQAATTATSSLSSSCPESDIPSLYYQKLFRQMAGKDVEHMWKKRDAYMHTSAHPPPQIHKSAKIQHFISILQQQQQLPSQDHDGNNHDDSSHHPTNSTAELSFGFLPLGRCGGETVWSMLRMHLHESHISQQLSMTLSRSSRSMPLQSSSVPSSAVQQQQQLPSWNTAVSIFARTPTKAVWRNHRTWIVLVRDPIERFKSWWTYHHPANFDIRQHDNEDKVDQEEQAQRHHQEDKNSYSRAELNRLYECYPTLQELIQDGHNGGPTVKRPSVTNSTVPNDREDCPRIAKRALLPIGFIPGTYESIGYSYINMERDIVAHHSRQYRILMVVRQERMVTDLNGIEAMMKIGTTTTTSKATTNNNNNNKDPDLSRVLTLKSSSSAIFHEEEAESFKARSSSEHWPVSHIQKEQALDTTTMSLLCRQMCRNIQAYKFLLSEAINLTNESYQASIQQLQKNCPKEASAPKCTM